MDSTGPDAVTKDNMMPDDTELGEAMDDAVKHPLQHSWSLWFFKNDKAKAWHENLQKVTTFSSVEEFWGLYNHVQPASKLPHGCDYCLFKDGVKPEWEDEANKAGGRWLINLNKTDRMRFLDTFWLETLLCLIGEAFEDASDGVNGAVVQLRGKGDKLAVWTADWQDRESVLRIGRKLKDRLNVPKAISISYQSHKDSMSKTGSTAKNSYTL